MIKVTFVARNGDKQVIEGATEQSLMELAKKHDVDIEAACGGAMACSTCHVIVDPSWYSKLPEPHMDETDMLDLASGLTRTSRLACQIMLTDAMDGLVVSLPK